MVERIRLVIFAKAPVAGQAKTRLIPALGPEGAAELHRRLVRHTLATASTAMPGQAELWCAPDCGHPFFRDCSAEFSVPLHTQVGRNLGERMANAFAVCLRRSERVFLVGTDCPSISAAYLRAAANARADAVVGPAEDGGYVLMGLARPVPEIFESVAWGTPAVLAETLARLCALGLSWHELPILWDIDEPADLARLERDPELKGLLDFRSH